MHGLLQNNLTENYRTPLQRQKSYFCTDKAKTLKFYIPVNVLFAYFDKVQRIEYTETTQQSLLFAQRKAAPR